MIVELPGYLVECPGRAAKLALPVVRRRTICFSITPYIPVPPRTCRRRSAILKPRMLIRGMIWYEVEDDLQAYRVGCQKHCVKVVHSTKSWVDVAIVRHIVTEVFHWR